MGDSTHDYQPVSLSEYKPPPEIVPENFSKTVVYYLVVVVFPLLFLIFPTYYVYQDGNWETYLKLMFFRPASSYFMPFQLYSIFCIGVLLAAPEKGEKPAIRLGVYTGVILALQYSILFLLTETRYVLGSSVIWLIIIPIVFKGIKGLNHSVFAKKHRILMKLGYFIVGVGLIFLLRMCPDKFILIASAFASIFYAIPFLCLFIYLQISIRLVKFFEIPFVNHYWQGFLIAGWLGLYHMAWQFSIREAIEMYSKLSPFPPDCYIATAAARGHPRLVRSILVVQPDGSQMRINPQIQILKAAEIALKVTVPKLHLLCRTCYDRCGKALSYKLTTPTRASLVYLGLKPFEWVAERLLKLLLPGSEELIGSLYHGTYE